MAEEDITIDLMHIPLEHQWTEEWGAEDELSRYFQALAPLLPRYRRHVERHAEASFAYLRGQGGENYKKFRSLTEGTKKRNQLERDLLRFQIALADLRLTLGLLTLEVEESINQNLRHNDDGTLCAAESIQEGVEQLNYLSMILHFGAHVLTQDIDNLEKVRDEEGSRRTVTFNIRLPDFDDD